MNARLLGVAIAVTCLIAVPSAAVAESSGGGHGGGHASGGHGGGHASGGHGAGPAHGSAPRGTAVSRGAGGAPATSVSARTGARSHDGQPVVGTAVPRTSIGSPFATRPFTYSPLRFRPYYAGAVGLGLYDPFWPGYGSGGYGSPAYSYGYDPSDGYGVPSPPPTYGGYPDSSSDQTSGNVRLLVEPSTAQVYVDGYYVGTVEDFNHSLAGMNIEAGPHRIEFRAPGYETLTLDVKIESRRTITYRGSLPPVRQ